MNSLPGAPESKASALPWSLIYVNVSAAKPVPSAAQSKICRPLGNSAQQYCNMRLRNTMAACLPCLTCPGFAIIAKTRLAYRSVLRSEEHTSELQSRGHLVCRLLLEKKNK